MALLIFPMHILRSVFAIIIFVSQATAQKNTQRYTFSGNVQNHLQQPLPGASIFIPDLKKGAIADTNGNFRITSIPSGTYLVEIKFVVFQTILDKIYFDENKTASYLMDISITEENEIVITGTSRATSLKRNPVPIISVSKEYLQHNLSTNVIDALAKVPGINAVTTGPNVSKPFIRGLGFNRILTLYDGIRQEGQQWGEEHGVEIDQNTVEKVEIVKGPASLIYGSDALAGVVNLIPAKSPPEGKILGNLLNEYHTNNGMIENSAGIAGNLNDIKWEGIVSHKIASNYRNRYDGRVYNTGYSETAVSGNIEVDRNWGYSKTGLSLYDNLQEIPDGKRDSASRKFEKLISEENDEWAIVSQKELRSYKISNVHQRVQHYRIYNSSSFVLGHDRLSLNTGFQRSLRREYENPEEEVASLYLALNTLTYDAKYFFHETNGLSFTAGINGMVQSNQVDKGSEFIIPAYRQFDIGPFLFVKKSVRKLEIAGGLRYDVRNFRNEDFYVKEDPATGLEKPVHGVDTLGGHHLFRANKQSFSGVSGSLGLSYRFDRQWSAKFNLGRGYRAPNISEISSNGVHSGTKIYQLGNAHFRPEFNLQQDLGITYQSEHVTINADIFNNHIQNYIYNQKVLTATGEDSVIVPGNETFQFVASRAHLYGGEFIVDIHPHPLDWLHFETSLSVAYAINRGVKGEKAPPEEEKYLPFIPPLHTKSEVRGDFNKIGPHVRNAFFKIQLEVFASQQRVYLANNTETPSAGYHLFNAGLGADITNGKGNTLFTFSVFANNIFDIAYQAHLNRLKYFEDYPGNFTGKNGIYNMGRNIGIKLNIPFTFKNRG